MIEARKQAPCVDCLKDPRTQAIAGAWPVSAKALDQPVKNFWLSGGSDKANRRRTGRQLTYDQVSDEAFREALAEVEVVCASHMNWRTMLRRQGSCPECAHLSAREHAGNKCKCPCHIRGILQS